MQVVVGSRAEWRRWLAGHHRSSAGVWVVTYKKSAGDRYVPYDDIVDEALCVGWIDSLPRSLDAERSMRWVAPRKPKSGWSAVNKARIARLVASGAMKKAGLEVIERAKKDGSWGRLDAVETLAVPADLAAALARVPKAKASFEAFPRSSKRNILEWIASAKRDETRAARVEETARMAAKNERANHWRQPKKKEA